MTDKPECNYVIWVGNRRMIKRKSSMNTLSQPILYVSIKISDCHDSLSVFPCDEDDVMAFRVPLKLFNDHKCVMRIEQQVVCGC